MNSARIIVLFIALAAGGIAALLVSRSDPENPPAPPAERIETVDVLIASSEIDPGTALSDRDVRWQAWPAAYASANFIRRNERPDAIQELTGFFVRQSFAAGEPIREAKLIKARGSGYMATMLPEGMRAVATDILPESSAGGFILPNDRVDVILTRRDKHAEKVIGIEAFNSTIIISNVRVLAIDQNAETKNGRGVIVGRTATLELTPGQVETFMLAKQMGTVSLALRSIADFETKGTRSVETVGRNMNSVRFGITSESDVQTSGTDDGPGTDVATSARPIIRPEGSAEPFRKPSAHQARRHIVHAARRKSSHYAHRPRRIGSSLSGFLYRW